VKCCEGRFSRVPFLGDGVGGVKCSPLEIIENETLLSGLASKQNMQYRRCLTWKIKVKTKSMVVVQVSM